MKKDAWILMFAFLCACSSSHKGNHAPQLQLIEDTEFTVNQSGAIDFYAVDDDGDALNWSFEIEPAPPTQTAGLAGKPSLTKLSEDHARLTWTPGVADVDAYSVVISVNDGRGGEDSGRFGLMVVNDGGVSQGATLRFMEPQGAGMSVDLAQTRCIQNLPVTVKGDQIANDEVQIWMAEPQLEGAKLKGWGKEREFSWCPSEELLNNSLNHAVIFETSQSGSDLSVQKHFWFRFKRQAAATCAGAFPVITHQAPEFFQGQLNYEITATITDDIGFKAPPYLVFSTEAPQNGDTSGWTLVDFVSTSGNEWKAEIPNLRLAEGETSRIYYKMIATDNDDHTGTACDHTTESEIFSVLVQGGGSGGESYGFCQPCVSDEQCGGADDACVPLRGGSFCTVSCADRECENGSVCSIYESVDGVVSEQCLPLGLDCGQVCVIDDFDAASRNNEEATATVISAGQYDQLSICSGDEDFYKIAVQEGQKIIARIEFTNARGDLDMAMALPGDDHYYYQSQSGEADFEQVQEKCVAHSGDAYLVVYAYENQENEYRLSVEISEGECALECENDKYDVFGGNQTLESAIVVDLPFDEENLKICRGDVDFYSFNLMAGQLLDAVIVFTHADGDLNLSLYNPAGERVILSDSMRDMELLEYLAPTSGTYAVKVDGSSAAMSNVYELWIESFWDQSCEDDSDCPDGNYCSHHACINDSCSVNTLSCLDNHVCMSLLAGIDAAQAGGKCVLKCDDDSDCAEGYVCKHFEDYTWACAKPGTAGQNEACSSFNDCNGRRVCLGSLGGACVTGGCDDVDLDFVCEYGASCVEYMGYPICLKNCNVTSDCRAEEGQTCEAFGGQSVCMP